MIGHIYRSDRTNVGDWWSPPKRYFNFGDQGEADIVSFDPAQLAPNLIVGGGGLIANTFLPHMERLAAYRNKIRSLVAWGIGESLFVDRSGGFVPPYSGQLPTLLSQFDLVGLRDYGTKFRWVPCASCMLPHFDKIRTRSVDICIYEHKRIPIPVEGYPRRSNDGADIDGTINFLGSADVVLTNSYHGAYWATLLGCRVICIANMSKVYGLKHSPVICRIGQWKRYLDLAVSYPSALAECRAANESFYSEVIELHKNAAKYNV